MFFFHLEGACSRMKIAKQTLMEECFLSATRLLTLALCMLISCIKYDLNLLYLSYPVLQKPKIVRIRNAAHHHSGRLLQA